MRSSIESDTRGVQSSIERATRGVQSSIESVIRGVQSSIKSARRRVQPSIKVSASRGPWIIYRRYKPNILSLRKGQRTTSGGSTPETPRAAAIRITRSCQSKYLVDIT